VITRPPRLLVVDDDPLAVRAIAGLLAEELPDVEIEYAEDADSAIHLLRTEPFDVVVTDIVMPGRSGLELIRDLRAEGGTALRVIVMSGFKPHELPPVDVDAWHSKPVDAAALARDVARLLDLTLDRRSSRV
jgi:CheY-like chemotaxis protein